MTNRTTARAEAPKAAPKNAAPKKTTTRRPEAPKRMAAAVDEPQLKITWKRMFVAMVANLAAAAGIGVVFGVVTDALVSVAVMLTGVAFVGTVLSFLMQIVCFAIVLVAGIKIWDGVLTGTIEERCKDMWSGAKAWFEMRRNLRGVGAAHA